MGKSGVVQWDFWVNLNLTVKGKTRPQRVILEKNISGRTCILLNATCCTYITDEVHSTNLTNAVGRLVDLQQAMSEDRKSAAGKAWWEWLGFGGVAQTLAKGAILFLLILLTIGTVMFCIILCIRSIIGKLV